MARVFGKESTIRSVVAVTYWAGEMPRHVEILAKWNASVLGANGIPLYVLVDNNVDLVHGNIQVHSMENLKSSLCDLGQLRTRFFNDGPNPDQFEWESFKRFVVVNSLVQIVQPASVIHIDADLALGTEAVHAVATLAKQVNREQRTLVAAPTPFSTPLVFFSASALEAFNRYLTSPAGYWDETSNYRRSDMGALKHFTVRQPTSFNKMEFKAGNSPINNRGDQSFTFWIQHVYPQVPADSTSTRDSTFRESVTQQLKADSGKLLFAGFRLPFAHFQGWTKVFIAPVFGQR